MHHLQQQFGTEFPGPQGLVQAYAGDGTRLARLYREYLALGKELEMAESGKETIAADLVEEMRDVRKLLAGILAGRIQPRN